MACYSTQLSYPAKRQEEDSNLRHTRCGRQHRAKAACYTEFAVQHYGAIQKRTSGLILSVSSALPPDIVMEKDLYPPVGGNIFIKEQMWPYSDYSYPHPCRTALRESRFARFRTDANVALPGFEPGFLYRQHGSKCASLLNFSERFFGVPITIGTKSIRYSA